MKVNIKKLLALLMIFTIVFSFTNNVVFAEINSNYGETPSTDIPLDDVVKSSLVLDYIGSFIFGVGSIVENLTSDILGLVIGSKSFPWADRVIFNTIPLLDINFINPSDKSLLSATDNSGLGLGVIIRNVYFTGLSLALGFLGIIVAILAIRLAISTIAADKAKYKEAIVKWITSLVLLFGMHFVLSFIFYMNESLVIVASNILSKVVVQNQNEINAKVDAKLNEQKNQVVFNFISQAGTDVAWDEALSLFNPMTWGKKLGNLLTGQEGNVSQLQGALDSMYEDQDAINITYAMISNPTIKELVISHINGNNETSFGEAFGNAFENKWTALISSGWEKMTPRQKEVLMISQYVAMAKPGSSYSTLYKDDNAYKARMEELDQQKKSSDENTKNQALVEQVVCEFAHQYANTGNINTTKNIIALLGDYFKNNAWSTDVDNGGWSPTKNSIIGSICYTMFVFQSVMYFMAYMKRFFYVVVLSVMAPFVVIYDFFTKSLSL